MPYPYQPSYKQGAYCDFGNPCAYQGVGPVVSNSACRFGSVSPNYGHYAFQHSGCNAFFNRKPTRIKGNLFIFLKYNFIVILNSLLSSYLKNLNCKIFFLICTR